MPREKNKGRKPAAGPGLYDKLRINPVALDVFIAVTSLAIVLCLAAAVLSVY